MKPPKLKSKQSKPSLSYRMRQYVHPFSLCKITYDFLDPEPFEYLYEALLPASEALGYVYSSPTVTTATVNSSTLGDFILICSDIINSYTVELANVPSWDLPNWFRNCQNQNTIGYYKFIADLNGITLAENLRSEWQQILKDLPLKITLDYHIFEKGIFLSNGEEFIADFNVIQIK